jgi:hypothetical protein
MTYMYIRAEWLPGVVGPSVECASDRRRGLVSVGRTDSVNQLAPFLLRLPESQPFLSLFTCSVNV